RRLAPDRRFERGLAVRGVAVALLRRRLCLFLAVCLPTHVGRIMQRFSTRGRDRMRCWTNCAASAALLCALSLTANAQVTTARVTGAQIEAPAANGVASLKGIPFAAAPGGALRWKNPQPVVAWSGAKKTPAYAPACMQDPNMLKFI